MTGTQRVLAQRWRTLATAAALLALAGAVMWVSNRITHEVEARQEAVAEANKRGDAVTTLASDVRVLRAQLEALGKKPKAPDPAKAVDDLPARAEVPVPIPGPPGPKGDPGRPAPTITPRDGENGQPGAPGSPGEPGADSTVPGPQGPQGPSGADSTVPGPRGEQGERGPAGPAPSGWTFTDGQGVTYECTPDTAGSTHYTCRRTSEPEPPPEDPPGGGLLSLALDPQRRQYE